MYFHALGSLRVTREGEPVSIGTAHKPRLTLAALVSRADRPVSTEWLLSVVWRGPEPLSARRNLHQYVHRLRGALGAERLPVGWYQGILGHPDDALRSCQRALRLSQELDDRYGEALAWDSIGYANHLLGDHHAAADAYRASVTRLRQLADRHSEAAVLQRLGDSHHAAGDHRRAESAWRNALDILTDLGDTDVDNLREKLNG